MIFSFKTEQQVSMKSTLTNISIHAKIMGNLLTYYTLLSTDRQCVVCLSIFLCRTTEVQTHQKPMNVL